MGEHVDRLRARLHGFGEGDRTRPSIPRRILCALPAVLAMAVAGCGTTASVGGRASDAPVSSATSGGDPVTKSLKALLPPGAALVPPPGASGQPYLTFPLTSAAEQDVVALYVDGKPETGIARDCTGPRSGTAKNPPCHVLVATRTEDGVLRSLWHWGAGYALGQLAAVNLTGGKTPELLVTFPVSATFSAVRVMSFAGGKAQVLLAQNGGDPRLLPPPRSGGLPGVAFCLHDTGGSGTCVVWQWNASLGRFVRADGAFRDFYRQYAVGVALKPQGAAWVDYYAALAHLQAGEDTAALTLAEQGMGGTGYMHGSPAFYELEATVYRRQGDCERAAPLYQRVVSSSQPGGGIAWPALPRAYYGLALCAHAGGHDQQMLSYLQQAIAAGNARTPQPGTPGDDWYGFAQAQELLRQ